ncbi:MAG: Bax inhibitor-1/YccA family protein [Holosporales bacterium]|jgi:FtsH-binding integral membrane protein|nr:Bax inhibitor-1/YccA family protein [Holosporales bacterium]
MDFRTGPIMAVDDGLRKYMISVFNKMFCALCLTGSVSFLCGTNPEILAVMQGGFSILLFIVTMGIVVYLSARINKIGAEKAQTLFWLYSALVGASISPIIASYTGESIANAFFTSAAFFGGLSLYGYTTTKDLTGVGSFMMVGLITVVISSFINIIFLKSSVIHLGLSALSIIIFGGLTMYDIQKIKGYYDASCDEQTIAKRAVIGALSLYLDFLNLFLALLRFIGNRK